MEKEPTKTPIEKLLDELSSALDVAVKAQQKFTTAIKILSNLKNNPVDQFGDKLSKEYEKECMEKCRNILTTFN